MIKRQVPQPVKNGLKRLLGMQTQDDFVTMEMNVLPDNDITDLVRAGDCTLIRLAYSKSTEPDQSGMVEYFDCSVAIARIVNGKARSRFLSAFYFIRKET